MTEPAQRARKSTLTDRQREVLEAIVAAEGNLTAASVGLYCSPANVGLVAKHAGVQAKTKVQRAAAARSRLEVDTVAQVFAGRASVAETVTVAAVCHPDRQQFQMNLCRECYADRVHRSRSSRVGEEGLEHGEERYAEVWTSDATLRDGDVLEAVVEVEDDRVVAWDHRVIPREALPLERARDQLQRAQRAVTIALDAVDAAIQAAS